MAAFASDGFLRSHEDRSRPVRTIAISDVFTGERAKSPNDPKLSHGGAWRGSCEVRRRRDIQTRKRERTDETGASQK